MHDGIDWIHKSLPAVMGDPRYALLNAKRVCEMVIDVLVAAELLAAGAALRRRKRELATASSTGGCWWSRPTRAASAVSDASRIQRYDTILGLDR